MDITLITVGIYSYFLGSIPFGLILTKIFLNKDIREVGSGNIGTTNVLRTGNKFLAVSTLALDLLKGYISVYLTQFYYESLVSYSALICFMGHIYPIWLIWYLHGNLLSKDRSLSIIIFSAMSETPCKPNLVAISP